MKLIGREQELSTLERYYAKQGSGLVVVYGERLLGKESLIRAFGAGKPFLYLHAKPLSALAQISVWARELRGQGIAVPKEAGFAELFLAAADSGREKGVLVIADFEHLFRTSGPKFAEEFFEALKKALEKGNLMVVFTSSSQSFVEGRLLETVASQGKLVSGILKVKPLDFMSLLDYFEDSPYNLDECIQIYSLLGGYPGAWEMFGKTLPFREAFFNVFFAEGAPLGVPEEIFLEPYLRELAVYNTILYWISAPREAETHYIGRKLNDLFDLTAYSRPKILVYIKQLISIGAVEKLRNFPVSEDLQVKAVYQFANPILRFYYTYLFAFEGDKNRLFAEILFRLPGYSREAFRKACEEYLRKASRAGELPIPLNQLSGWVGKNGSLDLLGRSSDDVYLAATISGEADGFSESRLNYFLMSLQKARVAPAFLYLFSLHGYSPEVTARLYGIEGIYLMDESIWQKSSS